MRIPMTMMVVLAIGALACGDRSQDRTQTDEAQLEARRDVATEPPDAIAPQDGLPTASDQPENPADRELAAAIRQQLMADDSLSTSAQNVTIVAESGNVTLRGSAQTADEKARIETAARQAPGVVQIDNQIEVTQ
jgi:hypothetical protein